jgi:CBS domain-containing protein
MHIGGVMTTRLVTASPDESLEAAIKRMVDANVGSIVVCEGHAPVGIVTERDVLRLAAGDVPFAELGLAKTMTTNLLTVSADTEIAAAARLMAERGIRHLPVVEESGYLAGIVSIRDVLGFLVERAWERHDDEARETAHALLTRKPAS